MYNEKDVISKWNSEMYDCEETEIYDVEFALSVIGAEAKRILEIACGSGRFLVPMANAGHDVTGIDFDEHMLNRIPTKISGVQNIHWHKADAVSYTHLHVGQPADSLHTGQDQAKEEP